MHIFLEKIPDRRANPHIARGARVIACASPSKLDVTRTMGGADYAVDYTKPGWQKEVLKITGGRGVDVAYDPVGRIKGAISPPPFAYV
jgi:NADPH2:quinone reductase